MNVNEVGEHDSMFASMEFKLARIFMKQIKYKHYNEMQEA